MFYNYETNRNNIWKQDLLKFYHSRILNALSPDIISNKTLLYILELVNNIGRK
jgi:hypothetical protein